MRNHFLKQCMLSVLFVLITATAPAETQPKFVITPTIPGANVIQVTAGTTATVVYRVTNSTKITRNLTMVPIQGIAQKNVGVESCSNVFTLVSQQSCLLNLELDSSQLPPRVTRGPVICKTNGPYNNNPDPYLCSQPSQVNSLNVSVVAGFSIGGSISGLTAAGLVLQNNGGDNLSVASGATSFQFATPVPFGGSYNVTVLQQPGGLRCTVTNGAGTNVMADVTTVNVTCNVIFAYVTNTNTNNILKCILNANEDLTACTTSGTGMNAPQGIVVNAAGTFAYITNFSGNNVSKCSFDAIGNLTGCTTSGTGMSNPQNITINPAGTFAYVTNPTTNNVSKCSFDVNGDLTACTTSGNGLSTPRGITINAAGTLAYITNLANNVSKCSFDANGNLTACTTSGSGLNNPRGIVINAAGTFIYIANSNANNVSKCSFDANGDLTACTTSGNGLNGPRGITINAAGTLAYVANVFGNNVSKCSFDANENLIACTTSGNSMDRPQGIVLK